VEAKKTANVPLALHRFLGGGNVRALDALLSQIGIGPRQLALDSHVDSFLKFHTIPQMWQWEAEALHHLLTQKGA
jgi:hypothetical protein